MGSAVNTDSHVRKHHRSKKRPLNLPPICIDSPRQQSTGGGGAASIPLTPDSRAESSQTPSPQLKNGRRVKFTTNDSESSSASPLVARAPNDLEGMTSWNFSNNSVTPIPSPAIESTRHSESEIEVPGGRNKLTDATPPPPLTLVPPLQLPPAVWEDTRCIVAESKSSSKRNVAPPTVCNVTPTATPLTPSQAQKHSQFEKITGNSSKPARGRQFDTSPILTLLLGPKHEQRQKLLP